jgi:hypothetical protein
LRAIHSLKTARPLSSAQKPKGTHFSPEALASYCWPYITDKWMGRQRLLTLHETYWQCQIIYLSGDRSVCGIFYYAVSMYDIYTLNGKIYEWWSGNDSDSGGSLTKVLSQHLTGGTGDNHKNTPNTVFRLRFEPSIFKIRSSVPKHRWGQY